MSEQTIVGVSYYLFPGEYKAIDAHARALAERWGAHGTNSPKPVREVLSSPETPGALRRTLGWLWEQGENGLLVYYYDDTALLVGLRRRTSDTPESWKEWFQSRSADPQPYQCAFIDVIKTPGEPPTADLDSRWPKARVIAPPATTTLGSGVGWSDFCWYASGPNEYRIVGQGQNLWLHNWCFDAAHLVRLLLFHGKAHRYRQELEQAVDLAHRAGGLTPADEQACKQKQANIVKALDNFDAEWDRSSLGGQADTSLGKFFLDLHRTWRDQGKDQLQEILGCRKGLEPQVPTPAIPPEGEVVTMSLSGEQAQKLHEALLSAFDPPGLQQMLRFWMNVNLAEITSPGTHSNVVFELIRWAESQGRLDELIGAAAGANPGNSLLRAFLEWYRNTPRPAPAPGPATPPPREVDAREFREFIVAHFNESDLAVLCADLEQDLAKAGRRQRIDLEIVGGTDKRGKVLKLIQYLENRQLLPYLVAAVRKARPDFPG